MDTIRLRLSALLEWLIAAAIIAGVAATTAVAVPRFNSRPAVPAPVVTVRAVSAAVPPRAVSVPMLLFVDGRAVRLGDRLSDIAGRIGSDAQVGEEAVERVAGHNRLTRFYDYLGTRFALVFDADAASDPRVIGIYEE